MPDFVESEQVVPSPDSNREGHQAVLADFYGTFPYPWKPLFLDSASDPDFYGRLIRQEAGRADLSPFKKIWVAGCGTNQALITALRFPQAQVLGTDVSAESLRICTSNAAEVGVTNLTLQREGITESGYGSEFDFVVCTGVIHHNPQPQACLAALAAALNDRGLLELMVYNRFHRREAESFQQALGLLADPGMNRRERYVFARELAGSLSNSGTLSHALQETADNPEAAWADRWTNPHESAYDVESLWQMAESCRLTIESPRVNGFDKQRKQFLWTLDFNQPQLRDSFFSLPDRQRWQAVNLLSHDRSPLLWFYLRPDRDGSGTRVDEMTRNRIFLESTPARPGVEISRFALDRGSYQRTLKPLKISDLAPWPEVRSILREVDGQSTMRDILNKTGHSTDFASLYRARTMLATPEFPQVLLEAD